MYESIGPEAHRSVDLVTAMSSTGLHDSVGSKQITSAVSGSEKTTATSRCLFCRYRSSSAGKESAHA